VQKIAVCKHAPPARAKATALREGLVGDANLRGEARNADVLEAYAICTSSL
jgi:hypothetical protein